MVLAFAILLLSFNLGRAISGLSSARVSNPMSNALSFDFVCDRLDQWKKSAAETSSISNSNSIIHTVKDIPLDVEYEKALQYLNKRW